MVIVGKSISGNCSCKDGSSKTSVTGSRLSGKDGGREVAGHGYRYEYG